MFFDRCCLICVFSAKYFFWLVCFDSCCLNGVLLNVCLIGVFCQHIGLLQCKPLYFYIAFSELMYGYIFVELCFFCSKYIFVDIFCSSGGFPDLCLAHACMCHHNFWAFWVLMFLDGGCRVVTSLWAWFFQGNVCWFWVRWYQFSVAIFVFCLVIHLNFVV